MEKRHLEAKGQGQYSYDFNNDILLFKTKDRDYAKSLEFENMVIDVDTEGFITGLRLFDASKVFNMDKVVLNNVKGFELNSRVENKVITIQLRFTAEMRNKQIIKQGQDFVREALKSNINDSEFVCSAA